jgi:anthranilate phosphoribosyltransferase
MIHEAIAKVAARNDLTEQEMVEVMEQISEGQATPIQIGALIVALGMKGETPAEIAGTVRVLRAKKINVPVASGGSPMIDTAGTGGDGTGTFNVSTTAAFVAAGCGLRVAKHGNRSVSSQCGSADMMEALGVSLELTPEQAGRCIDEVGIGFLFAPLYHPAMRHAVTPRRELGLKSIFNLAGPLTNPADAPIQVVGVFKPELTEIMAQALQRLGSQSALVVHGLDGCDEISLAAPTQVTHLDGDSISTFTITPEEIGLKSASLKEVKGGDARHNAALTLDILYGTKGPKRDLVLANTSAALLAANKAGDLAEGVKMAAEAIDDGSALNSLERLVALNKEMTNRQKAVGE